MKLQYKSVFLLAKTYDSAEEFEKEIDARLNELAAERWRLERGCEMTSGLLMIFAREVQP